VIRSRTVTVASRVTAGLGALATETATSVLPEARTVGLADAWASPRKIESVAPALPPKQVPDSTVDSLMGPVIAMVSPDW